MQAKYLITFLLLAALLPAVPAIAARHDPADKSKAELRYPTAFNVSLPLASISQSAEIDEGQSARVIEPRRIPLTALPDPLPNGQPTSPGSGDGATAAQEMPAPVFNFEGISNVDGLLPPDPNGDIGVDHYIQIVNVSFAIWEIDRAARTATLVYGPVDNKTLWSGMGGACANENDGDPIVLFDHLANRWIVSQFALAGGGNSPPSYQCIAVSQSADPLGAWYQYEFLYSNSVINDYPKLGVWSDGYYLSANEFDANDVFTGVGVMVFEREKMLAGGVARQFYFHLPANYSSLLPSDLDGPAPAPGTPNTFAQISLPGDTLHLWEFAVNWDDPNPQTAASFGENLWPNQSLSVPAFDPMCTATSSYCIPQAGTNVKLDAIGDRLLHRLQYRNFGTYATLAVNHTVQVTDNPARAGIRWYVLRNEGSGWTISATRTLSQNDSRHRWMGSAALDGMGNLALVYTASSTSEYPSIYYAGYLNDGTANLNDQGEALLQPGQGAQTYSIGRWGDYSMISPDPLDDCTFWMVHQYYPGTSSSSWHTRVGAFAFPSCLQGGFTELSGYVTDSQDSTPLAGVSVSANGLSDTTAVDGKYHLQGLSVGTYTVTAFKPGYLPASVKDVVIFIGQPVQLDFQLEKSWIGFFPLVLR